MKLLRPLAGYNLYDHKTNDYIHREIQITGIFYKIDEYRRNWLLHLQRMPQNRIPLKSYHYRPQGRRTFGRPKKCWRERLLTLETERIKGSNSWCLWRSKKRMFYALRCLFIWQFMWMWLNIIWRLVTLYASFEAETFRTRIKNDTLRYSVYRHMNCCYFSLGPNAHYSTSFRCQT